MYNLLAENSDWSMWLQIVLIVLGCIFVLAVIIFSSLSAMLHGVLFSRQDKNPKFKYFTPEDFSLTAEDIPVYYRGENLYAKIYSLKPVRECERVVIFQHGFGAGTSSYMTEIAHFAARGGAVVAADAYGCNNSQGKKVYGFYAGAEAVIAAYIAVNKDERLKNKKIILVGHSWGAYSVCCAAERVNADGVVALSGFNAPAQSVCDQIKLVLRRGRIIAAFLRPFFYIINLFRFGWRGNTRAAKAIEKSGTKALLIHGEKDKSVPLNHSVAQLAQGENVTKHIFADKKHNPYNTVEAEEQLSKLLSEGGEDEEFFKNFDWAAATDEDKGVMTIIDNFIAGV